MDDEPPRARPADGWRTPDQSGEPDLTHGRSTADRERPAWLTYAQAADRLGLSPEAVRHRARRSSWRTMPGNDGRTLVLVPDDIEPVRTPDRTPAQTPQHGADTEANDRASGRAERAFEAALATVQSAHAAEVTALRERADAADRRVASAESALTRADARADQERLRADELRSSLETARADLQAARTEREAATAEAEQLRQVDAERRARGRIRRVLAAWRGD
jgi:hypothetical protein